ncbi:AbrB/MazE/SpoVT family DNA-binding domain-containing protein [Candidatus Woesearchaeota archaeon]|nr:AbrB/MazE/SpoVT family DNA-binding domain-containing protein [Candidatus Woesearchaeota archaeon]
MEFENLKLKCECGGDMKKITAEWKSIEVRGWICLKCGEEILNPADAQMALEIEKARKRNLLTVKLRRVGKSNVVTVPQPIMEAEKFKEGQELEWRIEGRKLVLTP